eukprot:SAG11_NODE_35135_length_268_cov_0.615385_1_plen_27_part_01
MRGGGQGKANCDAAHIRAALLARKFEA